MKDITTAFIKEFIKTNTLPLISTQSKLCTPIIKRMCKKMLNGIKFDDIKTFQNMVIDGHHRYISSQIMNFYIGSVESSKTSATIPLNWIDVEFDENDWDTASKIRYLNEQDARYNNLDIETLNQMILYKNK